jgi:RNA polymerase sigma factor (sigma-70 family)
MSMPSDGTKLVNEVLTNGGPDGSSVSRASAHYEKLKPKILNKLKRYPALRGVSATSVFHSVIVRLLKSGGYKEVKSETAFLMSMSNNSIRNRNRAQFARCRDPRKEDRSDAARDGLAAPTPTPDEVVSDQEQVELARSLLKEMSPEDIQVLTLREGEELTFPEIGAVLDITEDAARKRYEAAEKRLFATMQREKLVP